MMVIIAAAMKAIGAFIVRCKYEICYSFICYIVWAVILRTVGVKIFSKKFHMAFEGA